MEDQAFVSQLVPSTEEKYCHQVLFPHTFLFLNQQLKLFTATDVLFLLEQRVSTIQFGAKLILF